jgi:hypothetical protein
MTYRDWRAVAEAADEFYGLFGAPVDQQLENITATAHTVLANLKDGTCRHKPADINRWTIEQLDLCAQTFCCPPPAELVRLVEYLLGADKPKRNGARKNREKFIAAAHHVAQYPDATPAQIARAIEYDQKIVIKGWLGRPEFQEIVGSRRLRIAHQQKKEPRGT